MATIHFFSYQILSGITEFSIKPKGCYCRSKDNDTTSILVLIELSYLSNSSNFSAMTGSETFEVVKSAFAETRFKDSTCSVGGS